jgi:hypothetical protein
VLVLTGMALADDDAQRDKLTGSWQMQSAGAKEASTWVVQRSADAIHMAGSNGAKTLVEFDCKMAQECDIRDSGHHARVTIYFSGPKLIETETIGSRVVKRRFTVTGDGNTMELEVIPIEPEGKTETVLFKRVH